MRIIFGGKPSNPEKANDSPLKNRVNFRLVIPAFLLCIFFFGKACSPNYSPKPSGYFQINLEDPVYEKFSDYFQFEFDISSQMKIVKIPDRVDGEWFNLAYPSLNAQIYCSYFPITPTGLARVAKESRKLAYLHEVKADAIHEQIYENPQQNVYGLVYAIQGDVPSPVQFVLTDSLSAFFRGALYFNDIPNQDSIAPVLEYINHDIQTIIESFRWKK